MENKNTKNISKLLNICIYIYITKNFSFCFYFEAKYDEEYLYLAKDTNEKGRKRK